jgi:hypothetical protein
MLFTRRQAKLEETYPKKAMYLMLMLTLLKDLKSQFLW